MRSTLTAALLVGACGHQPHWPENAPANRCEAGAFPDGPIVLDVKVGDRTRRALVWVPPTAGKKDVVVNLHEFRSEPLRQAHYSGWVPAYKDLDVILVAPDGKSATWNAGLGCCGKAAEENIDDVVFLDAVIARLDAVGCTSGRVLATGIGLGGMMAERWACGSDVPDAVVTVGGALQLPTCDRTAPLPRLHYHGTADTFVPLDGSRGVLEGGQPGGTTTPTDSAASVWAARAGGEPTTLVEGSLTCRTWTGAAPVVDCRIAGGDDTWPGAENGKVASASPLADATRGAWSWVRGAWDAPPPVAVPPVAPATDPAPDAPGPATTAP